MEDREGLKLALTTARAVLNVLEQQAAGYTVLTIPAHLKIQLEEKRNEVASLEARLAQMEGRHATKLPDNLLRRPDIFVGRKDEIARCLTALAPEERGWGATIDGIGGIGKTALALEVAHMARERGQFDAYLFASAKTSWLTPEGVRQETLSLSSLDAFVREFARFLGETDVAQMADATERRRALLDALRGRRALLIWDNLETLTVDERDLIAEFLRKLPAPNKAIVTSRHRTGESALTIRLNRLAEKEALALMDELGRRYARLAGELRRATDNTRRAIYEAAGGNPLAINWTLGLVAQKGYSLTDALAHLQDAARSNDLYGFLFADSTHDLAESDRTVLSALSTFQTSATPQTLADATSLVLNQVQIALERLVTLSLVNDLESGRYGLHPLTRTYVRAALGEAGTAARPLPGQPTLDASARRKALQYWVDYAAKYGGSDKDAYKTYDRLEAEWPNLDAAASALRELAGVPGPVKDKQAAKLLNDLARALRQFLRFRGYWDERAHLSEWAYEATQAMGDWQSAGWRAYDVAMIHLDRAETDRAQVWADRCAEAWERGGGHSDRAEAARLRGLIAQQRKELAEAERLYTEALTIYRDLGEEVNQATVLNDLGLVARERKDYARAQEFYRQALAIAEKIGNREQQAYISGNLGLVALDQNNPAEARRWCERELALAQEVGRQELVAYAQAGLAEVLEKENRPAEALPLAEEALRIRERLRDSNLDWTRRLVERLRKKTGK
jgi:tetratricopeptide (TPR) repeat protein